MRKAFTILELLAASALTALLMLAVLHVIGTLGKSKSQQAVQAADEAWRTDLLDTLRRDLGNATQVQFRTNGLTLVGHGALNRSTLEAEDEPVTVVYGLSVIDGRSWLVRRQAPRDGRQTGPWAELLCGDIMGFTVRPSIALPTTTISTAIDAEMQSVPGTVSVVIDGPSGRLVDTSLVLK